MNKNDSIRVIATLFRVGNTSPSGLERDAMREGAALVLERVSLADPVGRDVDDVIEQVVDVLHFEGWSLAHVREWLDHARRVGMIAATRERDRRHALIATTLPAEEG